MLNNKKPLYLMAAGKNGRLRRTFLLMRDTIQSTGRAKPTVAYVGVASLKDNWLIYFILSSLIRRSCKCRVKRVVIAPKNADLNKAREILQSADAIFMSGGDVAAGMQVLKQKNMASYFQELFQQGKQFIGGSAGSILMTGEWVQWRDPKDDSTAELFSCLGFRTFYLRYSCRERRLDGIRKLRFNSKETAHWDTGFLREYALRFIRTVRWKRWAEKSPGTFHLRARSSKRQTLLRLTGLTTNENTYSPCRYPGGKTYFRGPIPNIE